MPYARKRKASSGGASKRRKTRGPGAGSSRGAMVLRGVGRNVGDRVFTMSRVYHDDQSLYPVTICSDGGGYMGTRQLTVSLSLLPQFTELQNIWDEYRIIKAEVTFVPRYITNVDQLGGTGVSGTDNHVLLLGWMNDANSSGPPSAGSEQPWLERESYRQVLFNDQVTTTFYPKAAQAVYNGIASTIYGAASAGALWLPCQNAGVPHYGLAVKIYAPNATGPFDANMCNTYIKLTVQFRQIK